MKDFLPDLIFMDHRMPRRDGIQATKILKDNESTKGIPVTSCRSPRNSARILRQSFAQALPKRDLVLDHQYLHRKS